MDAASTQRLRVHKGMHPLECRTPVCSQDTRCCSTGTRVGPGGEHFLLGGQTGKPSSRVRSGGNNATPSQNSTKYFKGKKRELSAAKSN